MTRTAPRLNHDLGLLLIRLMVGIVFVYHGSGKLFGVFGGHGLGGFSTYLENLGVPMPGFSAVLAALAEFLGGLALLSGVWLRWAMIPLCFTMLVAVFGVHWQNGLSGPDGYEYPLTLGVIAAALFFTGAGRFALPTPVIRKQEQEAR